MEQPVANQNNLEDSVFFDSLLQIEDSGFISLRPDNSLTSRPSSSHSSKSSDGDIHKIMNTAYIYENSIFEHSTKNGLPTLPENKKSHYVKPYQSEDEFLKRVERKVSDGENFPPLRISNHVQTEDSKKPFRYFPPLIDFEEDSRKSNWALETRVHETVQSSGFSSLGRSLDSEAEVCAEKAVISEPDLENHGKTSLLFSAKKANTLRKKSLGQSDADKENTSNDANMVKLETLPERIHSHLQQFFPLLVIGSFDSSDRDESFEQVREFTDLSTIEEVDSELSNNCSSINLSMFPQTVKHVKELECDNNPVAKTRENDEAILPSKSNNCATKDVSSKFSLALERNRRFHDKYQFPSPRLTAGCPKPQSSMYIKGSKVSNFIPNKGLPSQAMNAPLEKTEVDPSYCRNYDHLKGMSKIPVRVGASELLKEKGILEQSSITLIGPELSLDSISTKNLSRPRIKEAFCKDGMDTQLSESLMSFLHHEASCMAGADEPVSLLK